MITHEQPFRKTPHPPHDGRWLAIFRVRPARELTGDRPSAQQ
jgi:hypothetical protein